MTDPTSKSAPLSPALEALYGGRRRLSHFAANIATSFPHNSSPHIVSMADFATFFRRDTRREMLLEALAATTRELSQQVQISGLLVAGSFLDLGNSNPKDLDGSLFYSAHDQRQTDWAAVKGTLEHSTRRGMDLRPVPLDGNPLIMIKVISFMTSLYLADRDSQFANNGMLLVSCDQ